jgi:hypothetical protein
LPWASGLEFPCFCWYRTWAVSNDKRNSSAFSHYTKTPQLLQALGIEYQVVSRAEEIEEQVGDAVRVMNSLKLPVALLFTGEFTL